MIKYTETNVFNTDAMCIVNTINCVGFMGKGLALEFALRYPDLLDDYKRKCDLNVIKPGKIYYYRSIGNQMIANFPTKNDFKFPSKIEWVEECLKDFANTYKDNNITSIALPLLGCGNGGLDYKIVKSLMEKYLIPLDCICYICLASIPYAEGKEKEMVDSFKKCNINTLSNYVKLNTKQIDLLINKQKNIERFYEISTLSSIGKETYKNIFNIFYNNLLIEKTEFHQESLF